MATLIEISEAIESIESKKQSLKQSFEDLQKQSQSFSSFSLTWQQMDTYFSQIQSSLQSRFSLIQQKEQSLPQIDQNPQNPFPQISQICQNMETLELTNWVKESLDLDLKKIKILGKALKFAKDPFKLVLDALEVLNTRGKSSVFLLEGLMMVEGVKVSEEMRERAKLFAFEWKKKMKKEGKLCFGVVGFLNLLGCFGLVEYFVQDEVLELFCGLPSKVKYMNLCRVLGLEDKVPDLIEKLIKKNLELSAMKFAHEFMLVNQYPPVELLRSYVKKSQKFAKKFRRKRKSKAASQGAGNAQELRALNTALKYMGLYKLESKYPPEPIIDRIKKLEAIKANKRKRKSSVNVKLSPKPTQMEEEEKVLGQQLQNSSKQPVAYADSVSHQPPPYLQPQVLLVEPPGLGSSVGSYAFSGFVPNAPYGSHLHGLGSQLPSSSYLVKGSNGLDAYGFLPQHHPTYHPRNH